MNKLKEYLLYDCVSFAILSLILSICTFFGVMTEVPFHTQVVGLFLMTTLVEVLKFFTDRLPIRRISLMILVDILDIAVVVFILLPLLGDFTFSVTNILIVLAIIILVYAGVVGIAAFRNQRDSVKINRMIQARRKEQQDDKQY